MAESQPELGHHRIHEARRLQARQYMDSVSAAFPGIEPEQLLNAFDALREADHRAEVSRRSGVGPIQVRWGKNYGKNAALDAWRRAEEGEVDPSAFLAPFGPGLVLHPNDAKRLAATRIGNLFRDAGFEVTW